MYELKLPSAEFFNDQTQEFISVKECTLQLEHSLLSLSKWESKWCKPFLSRQGHSFVESVDYVKCMTLNKNIDPNVYLCVTPDMVTHINNYIQAPMTATTFKNIEGKGSGNTIITAQIIYYWMISLQIPFECQKWHLNRLMALIRVCNEKQNPGKKMSRRDAGNQNRQLNAARKARMNSRG